MVVGFNIKVKPNISSRKCTLILYLKQQREEEQQKQKAEEDARLDTEFEIWNEEEQARRQGLKNDISELGVYRESKHWVLEKPTHKVYMSPAYLARVKQDDWLGEQPYWGDDEPGWCGDQPGFRD